MTAEASLLAGVDRALFAASFTHRLRDAGLATGMTATERFARGLAAMEPRTVTEMYLVARACLLDDVDDPGAVAHPLLRRLHQVEDHHRAHRFLRHLSKHRLARGEFAVEEPLEGPALDQRRGVRVRGRV